MHNGRLSKKPAHIVTAWCLQGQRKQVFNCFSCFSFLTLPLPRWLLSLWFALLSNQDEPSFSVTSEVRSSNQYPVLVNLFFPQAMSKPGHPASGRHGSYSCQGRALLALSPLQPQKMTVHGTIRHLVNVLHEDLPYTMFSTLLSAYFCYSIGLTVL